ncbi:DHHC zinc finger domain-containing protein [Besnoitia besnoiti]|uniref:Palmitoyltransferase n=1 Tax=Besnoitia besnoiti TaxID=94643 RepID=A0A2A9MCY1_BESBE|nr:DHHC zinc finger domain-containing protein [Besnoitia besnoiti]PFH33457.1 DHHC zinc finger domain-containing protein [Besnoitia besnoiti]
MLLLFVCLFFLSVVALALLWFFGAPEGNSFSARLFRFFFVSAPARLLNTVEALCGLGARRKLEQIFFYVFHTNNPIVQLVYLAVMIGGYTQIVLVGYPWIPNAYVGEIHKFLGFAVFLSCLVTFLFCALKDPGVIDHENAKDHERLYPYDRCIYFPNSKCSTCHFNKPARSKHCRLCNVCVARFDHHCVWIGNCVGARNHGAFIIFLLTHFLMCAYGSVTMLNLLLGIVDAKKLTSAVYIDPLSGRRSPATWGVVLQYMAGRFGSLIFLAVLLVVFFFLLLGFTAYHLYTAVWRNSTTNESFKYRCMRQILAAPFPLEDEASEAKKNEESAGDAAPEAQAPAQGAKGKKADKDAEAEKETKLHPPLMTSEKAVEHVKKARGRYHHGLVQNALEVFCFDDWMRETLARREEEMKRASVASGHAVQFLAAAVAHAGEAPEERAVENETETGKKTR